MALTAGLGAVACSPMLDWREYKVAETPLVSLFPCKPTRQVRDVRLAGRTVKLSLHVCDASGTVWGVAQADLADPGLLNLALAELRQAAAANIQAGPAAWQALRIPGATPHPASGQATLAGHGQDRRTIQMRVAVFVYGTRVFQATALGPRLAEEDVGPFFASLQMAP